MRIQEEAIAFTSEAEVRMQDLAEFLAKDTRINLALVSQLHDEKILLTPGAFLMLVIPLIEAARAQEAGGGGATVPGSDVTTAADPLAPDVVRESIRRLLVTIKEEPSALDTRLDASEVHRIVVKRKARLFRQASPTIELGPRENVRSSLSVIRAYWKRFCSIPPFCGGT